MMVQKRSAIGSGIGGGLKKPSMLKAPSSGQNAGITGSKIGNGLKQPTVNRIAGASPSKTSPSNARQSTRLPIANGLGNNPSMANKTRSSTSLNKNGASNIGRRNGTGSQPQPLFSGGNSSKNKAAQNQMMSPKG